MRIRPLALAAALVLSAACAPVPAPVPAPGAEAHDGIAPQRAFFEQVRALCGQTFRGRTVLAEPHDRTFEPARLAFTVEECGEDELRIPFVVGDDGSRTWILRMGEDGLSFVHEHLRPDGSTYEVSGFGGHASQDGTADFQHFPDFWTTDETPPEERRVWRLAFEHEHHLFVYYLDRGGRPAYRLVFWLGELPPGMQR